MPEHNLADGCPYCKTQTLKYTGLFEYDNVTHTDILVFTCTKCTARFTEDECVVEQQMQSIKLNNTLAALQKHFSAQLPLKFN